ncbi:DNA sulfur modification protein DndD [Azospirillum sp. SYSU D00513]|uniref:DNA sulfur modification protein DndD n=1 Tax=Azospirillum sp. SYSU D00513 TaxID=2812561 RepID=UPI001A9742F0|nr:DNA sulfur modification protein DndD [Azospirillum sp. SYSU D00513]
MILDELTLHNFGVYGGRQSIALTPDERRPITLIGGLNGGGKTTLLDALQLCLYGPSARCSNRNGLAYDDFLRRSIHHRAEAPEAAVEVAFRHTANGEEQNFQLHRSWRATGSGCRERFHVLRNGELDKLATEHWAEQVEDFIPARIAHLFFFDGEKVESYAELDEAPPLIATAVQNLLGLDIVERLAADLGVLERRKRTEVAAQGDTRKSEDLRGRIEALESARTRLVRERAATANALDRRAAELAAIEERYRREGGNLFERRAELEGEAVASERQLAAVQKELRELASGATPLLLVGELLKSLEERAAREDESRRSRETASVLAEEHEALLAMPTLAALPEDQRAALRAALAARIEARREFGLRSIILDLSADARGLLDSTLTFELPSARERLQAAMAGERKQAAALDHARNALAAAPSYDVIAGVVAAREAALSEVARLQGEQAARDAEIARLDREITQLKEREVRLAEAEVRDRFEREDVKRLLLHSAKVRGTLTRFREAVVARHVERIERLVLESFHQLIRKGTLITDLRIDPQTFVLELRGTDGRPMTADRLSAGERQLLAIAILWGLGRSSGRPLPTVIDTPLGRLDSVHRNHLVERYFPRASHQVLLLSTDEEIMGGYLNALQPSISRTYQLRFDEGQGRTIIEPGYLRPEAAHAH